MVVLAASCVVCISNPIILLIRTDSDGPHVPLRVECARSTGWRRIRDQPNHIFQKNGNWRKAGPAHITWFGMAAGCDLIRSVVFPESVFVIEFQIGEMKKLLELICAFPAEVFRLEDLDDILQVVYCDLMGQLILSAAFQPFQNHIIRGSPYSAAPIASGAAVIWIIGGEGRDAVCPIEFRRIIQMGYKAGHPLRRDASRQVAPNRRRYVSPAIIRRSEAITVEIDLVIPKLLIGIFCQLFDLFGQIVDLGFSSKKGRYLQQNLCG